MKFLHLADLHLGRRIFGYDLEEEQRDALEQALAACDEYGAEGVLIAGDVYDVATPSVGAVNLLDWFLDELHKRNMQVFMISGNHDSAGRLNFGSSLMKDGGIYISAVYSGKVEHVDLNRNGEKIRIHLLPFIKPAQIRAAHDVEVRDWNDAMAIAMESVELDEQATNILVSHQFYAGGLVSESEVHPVGNLDQISTEFLEPFDYAALGHLHNPQSAGKETNRYPGTLIKYSASELGIQKTLTLLETKPDHSIEIQEIPLRPKRDFVKIQGTFDELVSRSFSVTQNPENYFYVVLEDREEVFQVYEKLQTIYPRLLKIQYAHLRPSCVLEESSAQESRMRTPEEIYLEFYEKQNGHAPAQEQVELMKEAWEAIHETH